MNKNALVSANFFSIAGVQVFFTSFFSIGIKNVLKLLEVINKNSLSKTNENQTKKQKTKISDFNGFNEGNDYNHTKLPNFN